MDPTRPLATESGVAAGPTVTGRSSVVARLWSWVTAPQTYPPSAADLRTVGVLGVALPVRATLAIVVVTIVTLLDHSGTFERWFWDGTGGDAGLLRARAISRAVVLGLGSLAMIVLVLRDHPRRYGVRLGDWRAGIVIGITGAALMTPVVFAVGLLPSFREYYVGAAAASPLDVVLTTAIEVIPAELFFRGLLMFSLIRVMGPLGIVVAQPAVRVRAYRQARDRDAQHLVRRVPLRLARLAQRLRALERADPHLHPVAGDPRLGGDGGRLTRRFADEPYPALPCRPPRNPFAHRSRPRSSRPRRPASRHDAHGTGRRPTGCVARSRPRAGRSSTRAATSRCARRIPRTSSSTVSCATGRARRSRRASTRHPWAWRRSSSSRRTGPRTSNGPSSRSRTHAPDGTQVIVVDDAVPDGRRRRPRRARPSATGCAGDRDRGRRAQRSAGRGRRAERRHPPAPAAPVVVILDTGRRADGRPRDAAGRGAGGPDRRRRRPVRDRVATTCVSSRSRPTDTVDVDAIEGYALAFRRTDYVDRGPLDEHFVFYRNLDIWWSLVLRDRRPRTRTGADGRRAIRRAVRVPGLPDSTATTTAAGRALPEAERDRLSKKNFYRMLKRVRDAAATCWSRTAGASGSAEAHDTPGSGPGRHPQRSSRRGGRRPRSPSPRARPGARRRVAQSRAARAGVRVVEQRRLALAGSSARARPRDAPPPSAPASHTRSRSSPSTRSASRTSHRRSSAGRSARSVSRTTASAVGRSRSSSSAATKRSWSARPAGESGAAGACGAVRERQAASPRRRRGPPGARRDPVRDPSRARHRRPGAQRGRRDHGPSGRRRTQRRQARPQRAERRRRGRDRGRRVVELARRSGTVIAR